MIDSDGECLWHNGQTGGYHSFLAFSPTLKAGVVVICDTATGLIDNIGSQLIRKQLGLPPSISPPLRKSIALSDEQIKNVLGDYQLGFAVMQIGETEKGMTAKLGNSRRFRFTSIPTRALLQIGRCRITFDLGDDGAAQSLTLHQNGRNMPAKRIQPATKPESEEPR